MPTSLTADVRPWSLPVPMVVQRLTCSGYAEAAGHGVAKRGQGGVALEVDEMEAAVIVRRRRHRPDRFDRSHAQAVAGGATNDLDIADLDARRECCRRWVVAESAARPRVQLKRRVPAAGDSEEVAVDPVDGTGPGARADCDGSKSVGPGRVANHVAHTDRDPGRPDSFCHGRTGAAGSRIHDQGHLDPCRVERQARIVGAVVRGEDHRPVARGGRVPSNVVGRGAGQHDPRPIIVPEDEGPLDGARGHDNPSGPHVPQPLARPGSGWEALCDQHQVVVVAGKGGGTGQDRGVRGACQSGVVRGIAPKGRSLVDQDRPVPRFSPLTAPPRTPAQPPPTTSVSQWA